MEGLWSRPREAAVAVAASALVAVALATALVRLPDAVHALNNQAAHNAQLSAQDRDLELARALGISEQFVLSAERLVPPGSSFAVETGPPTSLAVTALPSYLQDLLFPRFETTGEPDWLLCYGCDLARWRSRLHVAWRSGPLVIGRLGR
jgi:hypothetical protein